MTTRYFAWVMLIFLLGGCAIKVPTPTVEKDAEALLASVKEQQTKVQRLRGTARLRIEANDKVQASTQLLVMERPARLRADILSPFGQPLLQMTVQDGQLEAYAPGRKEVYRGQASAENLYRFTKIPLRAEELLALALYSAPLISQTVESFSSTSDGDELRLVDGARLQRLLFDQKGRLVGTEYLQDTKRLLEVRWNAFDPENGGFPKEMEIDLPLENARARLTYRKLVLNPVVPIKTYRLRIPESATIRMIP